jgi:Predicted membrane protein
VSTPDPQTPTADEADQIVARIEANPKYHELRRKRNTLGWTLTILMLVVYYGFIGLIAFDKAFLAQPIGDGVTTLGIPLAFGVIVFTVLITGIYVYRANSEYDRLTAEILKDANP